MSRQPTNLEHAESNVVKAVQLVQFLLNSHTAALSVSELERLDRLLWVVRARLQARNLQALSEALDVLITDISGYLGRVRSRRRQ